MADNTTTDAPTLFDVAPYLVEFPEPAETLSADRRRTLRHAAAIRSGTHPLALMFHEVRLHPDADRDASRGDGPDRPLRCGSCWYRRQMYAGRRDVPKCTFGERPTVDGQRVYDSAEVWPRTSHSAASDVAGWWPACADYSPGDNRMSRAAARWIPDLAVMP